MEPMDQYKIAKAEMKAAMVKANAVVKEAFRNAAKSLFADNPDIVSFSWTQYTPYFNDGDECTFGAHIDYPEINGSDIYDVVEEDQKEKRQALHDKVVTFLRVFDEDDFRTMFGDHCQVSVTASEIEVEEYEHD